MPETAIAVRIVENKSVQTSEIRMKAGFRLGAFALSYGFLKFEQTYFLQYALRSRSQA
jgi:hypothetical protein